MKEFDFDSMTDEELENLENAVFFYRKERREQNVRKSIDTIIDCIETEMKKCPALKDRTAIITEEDEYLDWCDLLNMIKNTYAQLKVVL